ncbi:MAG: hypothetical protein CVT79_15140 [Alphaproteobacteria bacterium HGW-Alphaproteobacteria-18]|nr:MAG: hypothetical protein CVT79_15140 [Alphaproteobacteria bacterium HGW-Alphaproteobacteria-18]
MTKKSKFTLDDFKPETSKDLADGIFAYLALEIGKEWVSIKKEIAQHVRAVSIRATETRALLAAGKITAAQADFEMHGQEYYLNNIILFSTIIPYVLAQKVLNAVFKVINAAFKNWTGVDLMFGSA